jgi:tripartite-type tricarboxylate transporter receptor subunit TctC
MASHAIERLVRVVATATALAVLPISATNAQSPAEFYRNKTIDMAIGYSAGGGYDLYARLIARHLGNHIPGSPLLAPKNMDGAGSLILANWLYGAAPRDGSAIGAVSRGAAFGPLLGEIGAQFDATKFSWIGSANDEVSVCVALPGSGITKFDDVLTKPLTIGATGVGDDTYQFPRVINEVLGAKFKIINGFRGSNEVTAALERGDVQGRCGWSWSSIKATRPDWVANKKIIVLVQMSLSKHRELPDVPLIVDLAKTDEERQIFKLIFARQVMGRPYVAPPAVPGDRVAALRQAFAATMMDKDFVDDAATGKFEINPVSGERLEALVEDIYRIPPEAARKAGALLR